MMQANKDRRCEIDRTYLKPLEVAIIDAGDEQNGGDSGE